MNEGLWNSKSSGLHPFDNMTIINSVKNRSKEYVWLLAMTYITLIDGQNVITDGYEIS